MDLRFLLCFCGIFSNIEGSNIVQCGLPSIEFAGAYEPSLWDKFESKYDRNYIARNPMYRFHCCGVVSAWEVKVGSNGGLKLQVWRQQSDDVATGDFLIGENYRVVYNYTTNPFVIRYDIPEDEQISVQFGDQIGWRAPADAIVYSDDSLYRLDDNYYVDGISNVAVGSLYLSFTSKHQDRSFAIKAFVEKSTAPHFTNLPANVSVPLETDIGSAIFVVSASDKNLQDSLVFSASSTFFTVNSTSGEVKVNVVLQRNTYTFRVAVTDSCGQSSSQDLTIIVPNQLPTVIGLPSTGTVHEDTVIETTIYSFHVNDPEGDTVTCSIQPESKFFTKAITTFTEFVICLKANQTFSSVSVYSLVITCNDGFGDISSTFDVYIQQNQPPSINNLPTTISVPAKSTSAFTSVFNVSASDVDDAQLTYAMTCTCPFTISSGGTIITTKSLEDEATPSYSLSVTVSDAKHSTTALILTIILTSINTAPMFLNLPLIVSLNENSPFGTVVTEVKSQDTDVEDNLLVVMSYFNPLATISYFSFDMTTQLLTLQSQTLNFEALGTKTFNITFSVSDGIKSVDSTLIINVIDVNESPAFDKSTYHLSCNEGKAGSEIPDVDWVITDEDQLDSYTFKIVDGPESSFFSINESGSIRFASDYTVLPNESPRVVNLSIQCIDSGGLSGVTTLLLQINNVNKRPVFSNLPAIVTIPEDVLPGTEAFQALINDEDDVTVDLFLDVADSSIFGLKSSGFQVYVKDGAKLDYEKKKFFNISFQASDGELWSEIYVLKIIVMDVNEAPNFSSILYYITCNEGQKGELLPDPQFSVSDQDAGDTGVFSIMDGNNLSTFSINATTGRLFFNTDFDVTPEQSPRIFTLTIGYTDTGGLTGTASLQIEIFQVNKSPTISNLPSSLSVLESTTVHTTIFQVLTADEDGDELTLQMTSTESMSLALFELNASDFSISLKASSGLDYETHPVHTLVFTVSDSLAASEEYMLTVNVVDANEPPEFSDALYFAYVSEGKKGDALPDDLFSVSDPDLGSLLQFTFVSNNYSQYFNINSSTGIITFNVDNICSILDPAVVFLEVKATDNDGLHSTAQVTLSIINVNEKPQFLNLPLTLNYFESTIAGITLCKVLVEDNDKDPLSYFITFQPPGATRYFSFRTSDSLVEFVLKETFDYEELKTMTVCIVANDGHVNSEEGNITFVVQDVNEAPTFSKPIYETFVQENKINTEVYNKLAATDPDLNDTLTYQITNGDPSNLFYITSTGFVYFNIDYDRDHIFFPSFVNLTISAIDQMGLFSHTNLFVTITDVNDNAPFFPVVKYTALVNRSDPIGSKVLTITAQDIDEGINAYITYQFNQSMLSNNLFAVSHLGQIVLTASVKDWPASQTIQFVAIGFDAGNPSLTGSVNVEIILREETSDATAAPNSTSSDNSVNWDNLASSPFVISVLAVLILGLLACTISSMLIYRKIGQLNNGNSLPKCSSGDVASKKPLARSSRIGSTKSLLNPQMSTASNASQPRAPEDFQFWSQGELRRERHNSRVEVVSPTDITTVKLKRTMSSSSTGSLTQFNSHMNKDGAFEF